MPASLRTVARQGLLVILVFPVLAGLVARPAAQGSATGPPAVMPQYDAGRNLILPANYREWVLIGSSLGLSYAELDAAYTTRLTPWSRAATSSEKVPSTEAT